MTASICAALACSSTAMVGIATLTMNASTPNMNCAATTIASTHQRREESTGFETIWCMLAVLSEICCTPRLQISVIPAITWQVSNRQGLARLLHGNPGFLQSIQLFRLFGTAFDVRL
jgi:hypothetical protein